MATDEITLRFQAVQKRLQGEDLQKIASELGRSRYWVTFWLGRYNPDDPQGSLQDHSRAPKCPYHKWSEEVCQMALRSRALREEGQQPGYQ